MRSTLCPIDFHDHVKSRVQYSYGSGETTQEIFPERTDTQRPGISLEDPWAEWNVHSRQTEHSWQNGNDWSSNTQARRVQGVFSYLSKKR